MTFAQCAVSLKSSCSLETVTKSSRQAITIKTSAVRLVEFSHSTFTKSMKEAIAAHHGYSQQ